MILDAGMLISLDRGERRAIAFLAAAEQRNTPLHVSQAVIAQVWRSGSRQVRLARLFGEIDCHALAEGREIGALLAHSQTSDVVDAHQVLLARRLGAGILTSDVDDLRRLVDVFPTADRPRVFAW